jgi:hypothetical protein
MYPDYGELNYTSQDEKFGVSVFNTSQGEVRTLLALASYHLTHKEKHIIQGLSVCLSALELCYIVNVLHRYLIIILLLKYVEILTSFVK